MVISPPKSLKNCKLVTGAIYRCDTSDRGFFCFVWSLGGKYWTEHGTAPLRQCFDAEIVSVVRTHGARIVSGHELFENFIRIRQSSATRLVWSKNEKIKFGVH